MTECTEIAFIALQPGATIEDKSSGAGKIWADTLKTVASQDGYQRSFYSRQVEDPTMLIWLIGTQSKCPLYRPRFTVSLAIRPCRPYSKPLPEFLYSWA